MVKNKNLGVSMRTFIAGLLSGALVFAAGSAWINGGFPSSGSPVASLAPQNAVPCERAWDLNNETSGSSAPAVSADHASVSQTGECIVVNDGNLQEVAWMLMKRNADRETESLQAEPKDPIWSAVMEQSIRHAVAAHALGQQFTLMSVDCRTLYCEVRAEYPMSGDQHLRANAFLQVVREAAEGLDLQVGGSGSGSMSSPGLIEAHARLRRFKPGDACPPGFQADCWNR